MKRSSRRPILLKIVFENQFSGKTYFIQLVPARQASDEARSSQHPSNLQNVTTACDELDLNKIEFTEEIEFLEAVSLTGPNSSAPNPVKTGYKTPFCGRENASYMRHFLICNPYTLGQAVDMCVTLQRAVREVSSKCYQNIANMHLGSVIQMLPSEEEGF